MKATKKKFYEEFIAASEKAESKTGGIHIDRMFEELYAAVNKNGLLHDISQRSELLPKLNAIELTIVFGSTNCEYSVLERKMRQLYENQEKILEAIKLVGKCR